MNLIPAAGIQPSVRCDGQTGCRLFKGDADWLPRKRLHHLQLSIAGNIQTITRPDRHRRGLSQVKLDLLDFLITNRLWMDRPRVLIQRDQHRTWLWCTFSPYQTILEQKTGDKGYTSQAG